MRAVSRASHAWVRRRSLSCDVLRLLPQRAASTLRRVGEPGTGKEVASAEPTSIKERNFLGSGMSLDELARQGDEENAITPAVATETDQMVTALLRSLLLTLLTLFSLVTVLALLPVLTLPTPLTLQTLPTFLALIILPTLLILTGRC